MNLLRRASSDHRSRSDSVNSAQSIGRVSSPLGDRRESVSSTGGLSSESLPRYAPPPSTPTGALSAGYGSTIEGRALTSGAGAGAMSPPTAEWAIAPDAMSLAVLGQCSSSVGSNSSGMGNSCTDREIQSPLSDSCNSFNGSFDSPTTVPLKVPPSKTGGAVGQASSCGGGGGLSDADVAAATAAALGVSASRSVTSSVPTLLQRLRTAGASAQHASGGSSGAGSGK
jgi:hypothetical protein